MCGRLLWVVFAACMHPLMWVFPFSFCLLFVVMEKLEQPLEAVEPGGLGALVVVASSLGAGGVSRLITKRRNGMLITTFRTGHGMSCWGLLRR